MDATPILLKMVTIAFMMDNDFLVLLVLLYYVQFLILIWSIISSYVLLIDYNATSVMQISKMIITLKSKFPMFYLIIFYSLVIVLFFLFLKAQIILSLFFLLFQYTVAAHVREISLNER